jgi:hypothetical protein
MKIRIQPVSVQQKRLFKDSSETTRSERLNGMLLLTTLCEEHMYV